MNEFCRPLIDLNKENEFIIEMIHFKKEDKRKENLKEGKIVAILEGTVNINGPFNSSQIHNKETLIFFPPGIVCDISFSKNTILVIFCLKEYIGLCQQFSLDKLIKNQTEIEYGITFLSIKPQIKKFMDSICVYLNDGLNYSPLFDVKIKELFILLKAYYNENEIVEFFNPLFSRNVHFTYFVLKNYQDIKTVKEFAEKSNLSISGFEKEFRKAFNTSPYRWMKQKRMKNLFYQISHSDKPLKEISEECGFSSTSQMNDFCKKEWGITPGKIRNNSVKKERMADDCEYFYGN